MRPVALPALLVLLFCLSAGAHEQKASVTRVLFNERTNHIEVMHRFLLHDAEHAGGQLFDGGLDLLGNPADRDRFARYVYERFSLADQDGNPLALRAVGNEIEKRFLWVYSETPIPKSLTALMIRHDALRDIWPDQTNLVNVERGKRVHSATFQGGDTIQTVHFPAHAGGPVSE